MDGLYDVYVKVLPDGHIADVKSSAFLADTSGWIQLDRGRGDKYHHAQGNYFPAPIRTVLGAHRYKLVDGRPVECSAEEIAEQEVARSLDHKAAADEILDILLGVTE